MLNAIRFINQRFAFKNSGISCLALIFNLKNPSTTVLQPPACKKAFLGSEKLRFRFSSKCYESMAQCLRLVAVSPVTWVWFSLGAETLCSSSAILRGTEPVYFCSLYNTFFLGICQWRSRADRVLTLNMNIDFHCFGALGVRPGARTRRHLRAWRMDVIIAIVEPQSKSHQRFFAILQRNSTFDFLFALGEYSGSNNKPQRS